MNNQIQALNDQLAATIHRILSLEDQIANDNLAGAEREAVLVELEQAIAERDELHFALGEQMDQQHAQNGGNDNNDDGNHGNGGAEGGAGGGRPRFTELWGLEENDDITKAVIVDAMKNCHDFVMKSQMDGGHGIYSDEEIPKILATLSMEERGAFILMKNINPVVKQILN